MNLKTVFIIFCFLTFFPKGISAQRINYQVKSNLEGDKFALYTKSGVKVTEYIYDYISMQSAKNLAIVSINNKHGLINLDGNIILEIEYDDIYPYEDELAKIENDNKYGLLDVEGKIVLEIEYDYIYSFQEEMAIIEIDNKYGYLDRKDIGRNGSLAIPIKYEGAGDFSEGLAGVIKNGKNGFINKKGETIIPFEYEEAEDFYGGIAIVMKNGKYGYINKEGETIIPFIYEEAYDFSEGIAVVMKNGKYGYINKNGNEITRFIFNDADDFDGGLAIVMKNTDYGYKYGYINREGKTVIPALYDKAYPFVDGEAIVKNSNKEFTINKAGTILKKAKIKYEYHDRSKPGREYITLDCYEYLNPFSGYDFIKEKCNTEQECSVCWMRWGQGFVGYYDVITKDQFYLGCKYDNQGRCISTKIYVFDDKQGTIVEAYDTEITDGLITNITRIKKETTNGNPIATSFIIASIASIINDKLDFKDAMGCALKFNVTTTVSNSIVSSIIRETIDSYTQNRNFNSSNTANSILESELKTRLMSESELYDSQIENITDFVLCLSK